MKAGSRSGQPTNPYRMLIEEAEGEKHLEQLATHTNNDVNQRATNILRNYFNGTED